MEQVKTWSNNNKKTITLYLVICIIVAGLNCIERADFNFLLYIFMYYTMCLEHKNTLIGEKEEKKERLAYLLTLIFSYSIDALWIYFYQGYGYNFSMIISYIQLVLKLPVVIIAGIKYGEVSKNSITDDFKEFREDIPF